MQTCVTHIWEKDGQVQIFHHFSPEIENAGDSAHVPGDVEAIVNRMLQAAREAGSKSTT